MGSEGTAFGRAVRALWQQWLTQGMPASPRHELRKRIRISNGMLLILIGIVLVYLPIYAAFQLWPLAWITLLAGVLWTAAGLLSHLGLHRAARQLTALCGLGIVTAYGIVMGPGPDYGILLLNGITLPQVMFTASERRERWGVMLLAFLLWGLLESQLFAALAIPFSQTVQTSLHASRGVLSFLFLGASVLFLVRENHQSEGALVESVEAMETEILERREVERALLLAQANLEEAVQIKEAFLATISHEIRTPIHGVIGMTQLLEETPLDDTQALYVRTLQSSGGLLLVLVNDLLNLSRMESGSFDLEEAPFPLALLLEDLSSLMQSRFEAKGLTLTIDAPPELPHAVLGDRHRTQQLLVNLVGNALKFTSEGGVTLSIQITASLDNQIWVRFNVRDTGIGIDASQIDKMFCKFTQADAGTNRRFGGSGLGLAICKQLTELMNGEIGAESTLGEGSTFWVELPYTLSEACFPILSESSERLAISLDILVAEDHPTNQLLVRRLLERLGCKVRIVENGLLAIEALQDRKPDVVLMDMQMPVLDGLEATRRIRSLKRDWSDVPIIALTANCSPDDQRRCLEAGMDDFLPKPFKLTQLQEKLIKRLMAA